MYRVATCGKRPNFWPQPMVSVISWSAITFRYINSDKGPWMRDVLGTRLQSVPVKVFSSRSTTCERLAAHPQRRRSRFFPHGGWRVNGFIPVYGRSHFHQQRIELAEPAAKNKGTDRVLQLFQPGVVKMWQGHTRGPSQIVSEWRRRSERVVVNKLCCAQDLCCQWSILVFPVIFFPDQFPFRKIDGMGERIVVGIYSDSEAVFRCVTWMRRL